MHGTHSNTRPRHHYSMLASPCRGSVETPCHPAHRVAPAPAAGAACGEHLIMGQEDMQLARYAIRSMLEQLLGHVLQRHAASTLSTAATSALPRAPAGSMAASPWALAAHILRTHRWWLRVLRATPPSCSTAGSPHSHDVVAAAAHMCIAVDAAVTHVLTGLKRSGCKEVCGLTYASCDRRVL